MGEVAIGDIVKTKYNSGTYIGKVIEDRRNFFLVEIRSVVEHPAQGDLHNPGQVEGVAFHERKALAFREKANARKRDTTLFTGDIPDYASSLKTAVESIKKQLSEEDTAYNKASLARIHDLEEHFYNKIYNN